MPIDPMRARALAVLRSGRCSIVRAACNDQHEPRRVMALVRSSRPGRGRYVVDYAAEPFPGVPLGWQCTCRNGQRGEPCAHIAAVQLVTAGRIETAGGADVNADAPCEAKAGHDPVSHAPVAGPASAPLAGVTS